VLILSKNVRIALTFVVTLASLAVTAEVHDQTVRAAAVAVLTLGAALGILPAHVDFEVADHE
jgi:hypothetical protein